MEFILFNKRGSELPGVYTLAQDDYGDFDGAVRCVKEKFLPNCTLDKLANVVMIRVVDSQGRSEDIPRDIWCDW